MPIKTTLSEPQSPVTPQAPIRDTSAAQAVRSVGNMLDAVGGMMRRDRQQKLETDRSAAIGQTTQQILDLEDEAIRQQQMQTSLEGEAFKIAQDGITADEQKRLDEIQSEQKRLNLLAPGERRLRLNALHKQALNDMANLNIQPQINDLFTQGRSRVLAPISTENEKIDAAMDAQYGVGNWTAVDRGRFVGNYAYQQEQIVKAHTNFALIQDNAKYNAMIQMRDASDQLSKLYNSKGHLNENDKEMYSITIDNNIAAQKEQIQKAIIENAKKGIDIREMAQKYMDDLDKTRTSHMSLIKGDARFGDAKSTAKVFDNVVKITDAFNKTQNAQAGAAVLNIFGNGGSGDFDTLLKVATMGDSVFNNLSAQLPEGMGGSANDLRAKAAQALNHMITGQKRPSELIELGLIPEQLLKVVSAVGVQKSTEPETASKMVEGLRVRMSKKDNLGILDVMNDSETVANLNKFKKNSDVRSQIQQVAANSVELLLSDAVQFEAPLAGPSALEVQDGKIVVKRFETPDKPAPTGAQMFEALSGRQSDYMQSVADGLNNMMSNYKDMIDVEGLLKSLVKTEESK